MSRELIHSRWTVAQSGYHWVDTTEAFFEKESKPVRVLTSGVPLGVRSLVMRYDPVKAEPALFRNFAELEPTEEAIRQFANKYGLLGISIHILVEHEGKLTMSVGEELKVWAREIRDMRHAVEVLEAIEKEDYNELQRRFRVSPGEAAYEHDGRWEWIYHENIRPDLATYVAEDDLISPAMFFIQRAINAKLTEHAAPRLLYNPDQGSMVLRIVPKNLLGAMWLQFAEAIDSTRKFDRCEQCNRWFAVSPSERTSRKFCSDACKSKNYRTRKEARRLHAAGVPIEEIASRLEVKLAVLQKWLDKEGA